MARGNLCRGYRPAYQIAIHEDGTVVYRGQAWVGRRGEQRAKVSPHRVRALAAPFAAAGYPDSESSYAQGGRPDSVEVSTALRWHGRSKLVRHYHSAEAPAVLGALEDAIDALRTAHAAAHRSISRLTRHRAARPGRARWAGSTFPP